MQDNPKDAESELLSSRTTVPPLVSTSPSRAQLCARCQPHVVAVAVVVSAFIAITNPSR